MSARPIQPDAYCANAAQSLTELNGALSAPEQAFIAEAKAREFKARWEADRAARAQLASQIIARELDGVTWESILTDSTRGDVAAKLYQTWAQINADEPITESVYGRGTGLRVDLTTAMALHGRPEAFREACRILGESITMAAIDYVLSCHSEDAEAVERDNMPTDAERREEAA